MTMGSEPAPQTALGSTADPASAGAGTAEAGDDAGAVQRAAPETGIGRASRSTADRIARQILLIENADPKALMSLRGSLVISAIRCVLTYALLPALVPIISWAGLVARPLSIALSLAAIGLSLHSLRRVWLADYKHRWPYTAFIVVVVALLIAMLVIDVRALLG